MTTTSVKYIGKRATYIEGAYGTGIHFTQGESKLVPTDKARLMLRHKDQYMPGNVDAEVAVVSEVKENDEENAQDMRDAIAIMDKGALSTYAKTHFSVKLDQRKDVGMLRSQVTGLVDQFGAV